MYWTETVIFIDTHRVYEKCKQAMFTELETSMGRYNFKKDIRWLQAWSAKALSMHYTKAINVKIHLETHFEAKHIACK